MNDTILINISDVSDVDWCGDLLTNGVEPSNSLITDLNSDYMAIVVANDIKNGIDPIVSIQVHYDEVKNDSIETWNEFFTKLEENK